MRCRKTNRIAITGVFQNPVPGKTIAEKRPEGIRALGENGSTVPILQFMADLMCQEVIGGLSVVSIDTKKIKGILDKIICIVSAERCKNNRFMCLSGNNSLKAGAGEGISGNTHVFRLLPIEIRLTRMILLFMYLSICFSRISCPLIFSDVY
ncbi:MAG: hypothetical protein P4L42_04125 [Desulfocapsaceae bacterium]|nr:hypothetical protein [Desulfocapsaceae bacterium]